MSFASHGGVRVGFASRPFSDCGELRISREAGDAGLKQELHDEVYIHVSVFAGSDPEETAVIISADTMDWYTDRAPSILTRKTIHARTGIIPEHITLFTTHTHASVYPRGEAQQQEFANRAADAVAEALEKAVPASMGYMQFDLGNNFTFNRRIMIDDQYGAHCLMFNHNLKFTDDNKVDASGQLEKLITVDWGGTWPVNGSNLQSHITNGPIDSFMHVFLFRDADDNPIGGMVRMAGHAVIVSTFWTKNQISADFPGVVSRILNQELGGDYLFIQGPAGDIRPLEPDNDFNACEAYGKRVAQQVLRTADFLEYEPLENIEILHEAITLPFNPEIPDNEEKCREEADKRISQVHDNVENGAPGWQTKHLMDRADFYNFNGNRHGRGVLNKEILAAGFKTDLHVVKLGEAIITAMPGEVFTRTAQQIVSGIHPRLRDRVCVCSLANHNPSYLPTCEAFPAGGYEVNAALTAPGTAEMIAQRLIAMTNEMA